MSTPKKELILETYVNEFGQEINPGDSVVFTTVSRHYVHIEKGTYVGYIMSTNWCKNPVKRVRVKYSWTNRLGTLITATATLQRNRIIKI